MTLLEMFLRALAVVVLSVEGVRSVQCTAYDRERQTSFTCPVACCVNSRSKECCNTSQVWNVVLALVGCVVVLGCIVTVLLCWVKTCINRGQKSRVIHPLSPHAMTMPEPPPYSAPGHNPPPYTSAPPSPSPPSPPPPFTPRSQWSDIGSNPPGQPVFRLFTTRTSGSFTNDSSIDASQNMEYNSVTSVQPVSESPSVENRVSPSSTEQLDDANETTNGESIQISDNQSPAESTNLSVLRDESNELNHGQLADTSMCILNAVSSDASTALSISTSKATSTDASMNRSRDPARE